MRTFLRRGEHMNGGKGNQDKDRYRIITQETARMAYAVSQSPRYDANDAAKKLANHILVEFDPSFFLKTEGQRMFALGLRPIGIARAVEARQKT